MATKKKTVKKTVTAQSLIAQARVLLNEQNETVTTFRKLMKAESKDYPSCKANSDCDYCKAARLIQRADRLRRAARRPLKQAAKR